MKERIQGKKKIALARRLEGWVRALADLGERSVRRPEALEAAAALIEREFQSLGFDTARQTYEADGVECSNIEACSPELEIGRPHLLIGAHYDSFEGTPGADDNASAVALMLELAAHLRKEPGLPVRFAAFVNEEPPYFQTPLMGSIRFAARAMERGENIVGMICLESLGVFLDEPASQILPDPLPDGIQRMPGKADLTIGNFVAVIGNEPSSRFMGEFVSSMRVRTRKIPIIHASMPELELSDHLAFWHEGYPAIMVTDTAMLRNAHYHLPTDTPEKLNYLVMTEILRGLEGAVSSYASGILKGDHIPIPEDVARASLYEMFDQWNPDKDKMPRKWDLPDNPSQSMVEDLLRRSSSERDFSSRFFRYLSFLSDDEERRYFIDRYLKEIIGPDRPPQGPGNLP